MVASDCFSVAWWIEFCTNCNLIFAFGLLRLDIVQRLSDRIFRFVGSRANLFLYEAVIPKPLILSCWRSMEFLPLFKQSETAAQLPAKARRVIPHDFQATALLRPVRRESGYERLPTHSQGPV